MGIIILTKSSFSFQNFLVYGILVQVSEMPAEIC